MTLEKKTSTNSRFSLPGDFSEEEMARDWTLSEADKQEIGKYRRDARSFVAVQMCAIKLYGRFLSEVNDLLARYMCDGNLGKNLKQLFQ